MRLLQEQPNITIRKIAQKVGNLNGAAYYCGTALTDKGFVKLKNVSQFQTNENYLHELTPHGIRVTAALTVQFLDRKKDDTMILKKKYCF